MLCISETYRQAAYRENEDGGFDMVGANTSELVTFAFGSSLPTAVLIFPVGYPSAGSGTRTSCGLQVQRIDPLHFVSGCRKRRLNRALSLLSLKLPVRDK